MRRRWRLPTWWEIKRAAKARFAYIYFKHINPDAAWCSLVMWFINDSPWEEVGNCTGCDYCGRATYGEIPASALWDLIPHPEGKTFNDAIFTSLRRETDP